MSDLYNQLYNHSFTSAWKEALTYATYEGVSRKTWKIVKQFTKNCMQTKANETREGVKFPRI